MARKIPRYIVDPPVCTDRVDDKVYARVKKQTSKWEPVAVPPDCGCGNVRPVWDKTKGKFVFEQPGKDFLEFYKNYDMMSSVISSAMLLYRLLCHFECPVMTEGPEGYKCIWWVTLKHKETGELLTLGEWKGAAGTWTKYHSDKELPAAFKKDILALLNELCAKDCPHPYDGTVAGCVA